MDMILNQKKMMNLLESFYTFVKVRVGINDLTGKEIIGYPSTSSGYCTLIRSHKTGDAACLRCDRHAFQKATKMKGPYFYSCHAYLTEMFAPIITSEEKRIGYLMIGQARQSENLDDRKWEDIGMRFGFTYPTIDDLKIAYSGLPILKAAQHQACANILQCLATYAWYDNYISVLNEPLSSRVKGYIIRNLDKPLSLIDITNEFHIGKTTLCNSIKKDFHITVNELIRSLRIDKAKQLLLSEGLPIYAVAEQVGIEDYNYFTKIFKEEIGVTPSIFRKLCENEYLSRYATVPPEN